MRHGLVQEWLTTNYDSLAQKAGCPQEKVAELNGSWFDPSNPILGKGGRMRQDLALRLQSESEKADLVLILGSSLSSPDQVVERAISEAALKSLEGDRIGVVVINLQHTPIDSLATIRIFADSDKVMSRLAKMLDVPLAEPKLRGRMSVSKVAYDASGEPTSSEMTELCLHPGSGVRLSPQHNCQSAGQPSRAHIGGGELVREGGRVTRRAIGEGRVVRYCATQRAWELEVEGVKMLLGYWWFEAAARGALPFLPVVNNGVKPARFQAIVRRKIMKTQKVAFRHGKVFLKIGQDGEIGLDDVESGVEPFAENNPNLTDCPTSLQNSNVDQNESAKDTNVAQVFALNQNADAEEEPAAAAIGNEQLVSERYRWESIQDRSSIRTPPSAAEQPKADSLSVAASDGDFEKEDPARPEQQTSQLQENGDSGYETSAPLEDGRSKLQDGIKEAPTGILELKTDLETKISPEGDPGKIDSLSDDGNKLAMGEEYEDKYDADEFEPDDEE